VTGAARYTADIPLADATHAAIVHSTIANGRTVSIDTAAAEKAPGVVAVFTAALVRRLSRPRLTALLGPRAAPARGHVLLVGFGQVGFRLARSLRGRGVPVLAVERDPDAPCLRLARAAGIPVAIRRGEDRATLELLGIRQCAVVAAVTSDDLVNVEVGLAASERSPSTPVVLRLGDGEVAAETDSLLHLGKICDAHAIVADTLTYIDFDGSIMNKAEYLRDVTKTSYQADHLYDEGLQVVVYGNAAVVSGIYRETGTSKGKSYLHRVRFTDTWIRQNGVWRCAASQNTLIPNK